MHTETATMVWAQTKVSMHMQKKNQTGMWGGTVLKME